MCVCMCEYIQYLALNNLQMLYIHLYHWNDDYKIQIQYFGRKIFLSLTNKYHIVQNKIKILNWQYKLLNTKSPTLINTNILERMQLIPKLE